MAGGAGGPAEHPGALPIWGGTDVMVELNFARKRPETLLDLTRVEELSRWDAEDGWVRIGAGVTYTRAIEELGDRLPGSRWRRARSARRRSATGGRRGEPRVLVPGGDALPPLYASGAEVELESVRGRVGCRSTSSSWARSGTCWRRTS